MFFLYDSNEMINTHAAKIEKVGGEWDDFKTSTDFSQALVPFTVDFLDFGNCLQYEQQNVDHADAEIAHKQTIKNE